MKKNYLIFMLLCFSFCIILYGCSNSASTSNTKESENNDQPLTITQALNAEIANDYLILDYTTSLQDHSTNQFLKVAEYSVSVLSEDEEYKFSNASIKIGDETFEIDENGCAEFTYYKDVSAMVNPIKIPELKISYAEGSVTRPNKSFKLNYFVDDEVVRSETISYGRTPTYAFTPTKTDYYFVGWSKKIKNIKKDTDLYAVFTEEITITYMFKDSVHREIKYGKGLSLGETNNYTPYTSDDSFAYWYKENEYKPFNFDNILTEDTTLYGFQKMTKYGNDFWNLSIVNAKNCYVPKNYGESFSVGLYAEENQIVRVYTTSNILNLQGCLLLAVNGTYHNNVTGNQLTILNKGSDIFNCPYIEIQTSVAGYYYFSLVSKISNSGTITFNISSEILSVY